MNVPAFPTVDEALLEAEILAAMPSLGNLELRAATKAFGHQTFRLRSDEGELLLKIARLPAEIERLRKTADSVALARSGGVRVPEILRVGCFSESMGSRPYLLQRFLPGSDAEDLWSGFSAESKLGFLEGFGEEVGKLHSIRAARFTEGNAPAGQDRSWESHVKDRLEKVVRYNHKASVLAFEELSAATTRIVGYLSACAAQVSPALVHRDLCLRNALVDASGSFAALLDFEHARLSDPLMDFVKLRVWVFETYPGSEEPFMLGYRIARPAPWPYERERLALCEGLELLGEIPYYHRAGNEPWLMQAVDRLRAWLVAPVSSR